MARRSTQPAVGNAADTGTPITPAPRKNVAPDQISRIRAPGPVSYGQNDGAANPSSIAPGTQLSSAMAKSLKEAQGSKFLDMVISGALHNDASGVPDIDIEERKISADQYPASHGMKSRQESDPTKWASLPETLGASRDDSAARRAAELKAGNV